MYHSTCWGPGATGMGPFKSSSLSLRLDSKTERSSSETTAQKRKDQNRPKLVTQASPLQPSMLGRKLLAVHSPCASGGPQQQTSNRIRAKQLSPSMLESIF